MTKIPGRNSTGHGGNIHAVIREKGCDYSTVIDFSANINPLGPPEWLRPLISRELERVIHYPDPYNGKLCQAIAGKYGVAENQVIAANGSTELLYLVVRILKCKRAVIPVPSYIDYEKAARAARLDCVFHTLTADHGFDLDCLELSDTIIPLDLVIIASPNNPTGNLVAREDILALATAHPEAWFLIDEAFLDFSNTKASVGGSLPNVITLNSMTKFYGVPGLRLGFGIFPETVADKVREVLPPWTVNSLAQAFGEAAVQDMHYERETIDSVNRLREEFSAALAGFPQLTIHPAAANYLFLRISPPMTAPELANLLIEKGILIRCCDNYRGLDESYFRVAVRTREENERFVAALAHVLRAKSRQSVKARRGHALMFQGTSSNAGKSVLSAAFCRILLQDGVRVAPFKAQNMSLNSYVTRDGGEMGRAQVVQAQAARLDPDVRMNPILLKPNSDTGSQIIVCGKPVGNMSVLQYDDYKAQAWQAATTCYDSLADEFEAIILEGAGSPGEVNLKRNDIVNMRMARHAESPVVLVGDIDRGGVYASFVGTMEVLAEWERQMMAGFLVNRFRGQASLLDAAHDYVLAHTGRRVLGVVPYLADLGLPEEDSVSFKEGLFNKRAKRDDGVDIVLLNFPHISNFTDVEPFLAEPDVTLRVVDDPADLGQPDTVILPGSKNVIGDLRFLQGRGFDVALRRLVEVGCELVGICGGYQMLGTTIADPLGIESSSGSITAMGLLDIATELKAEKRLTRQQGVHLGSGQRVSGYEIHHGISASMLEPVLHFDDASHCGSASADGRIWGAYLHGIFDSDGFRRWFIDRLHKRKGHDPIGRILAPYDLETSFDRLADTVRESVDMDLFYRLMNL